MNKIIYIVVFIAAIVGVTWWIGNGKTFSQQSNVDMLKTEGVQIISRDVEYFASSTGFLVEPEEPGDYPGVIMVHEWWGLNDEMMEMAEELSKQGYYVLAVDLYKGQVAATTTEARTLVASVNQADSLSNLQAARTFLQEKGSTKIGVIGWCFGGGKALELSVAGEPLDATVVYYGNLVNDKAKLANLKWPVLGIFGDKDTSIPVESVKTFDASLDELGVQNEIHIYPGVGHAFANPTGMNFAPNETKDAWAKTLDFLNRYLKSA